MYTNEQVEILRQELSNAYKKAKRETSMSWRGLKEVVTECIQEEDSGINSDPFYSSALLGKEISFSNDHLRKFANAQIQTMDDEKLTAVMLWLEHVNTPWSTFTKEKLFSKPMTPKVAELLTEFLYSNTSIPSRISAKQVYGEYIYEDNRTSLLLSIYESSGSENSLPLIINEKRRIHSKEEMIKVVYRGWLIITPNDSMMCVINNETEKTNTLFIPLGTNDDDFWGKSPLTDILFINQPVSNEFSSFELSQESNHLLNKWSESNMNNIVRFHRVS